MKASNKTPPTRLKAAQNWVARAEELFKEVPEKSRDAFERQAALCEAKLPPEHRPRWNRLSRLMLALAPALPKTTGSNTMLFFIPDGPYRKQVFALHARKDGTLLICTGDILDEASRAGLITRVAGSQPDSLFRLKSGESLAIEALDGKTPNPEPFYKDMTGWNRRAMCITLPRSATPEQEEAAESLCALSAAAWMGDRE